MRACLAAAAMVLVLVAPSGNVRGYGLRLAVPQGWHARVYQRPGGAPILQAANIVLSAIDGDDPATRTQARLRRGGVLIVLFEYEPPRDGAERWKKSFPVLRGPVAVQRYNGSFEGQIAPAATRRVFQLGGRYFDLIVFFGEKRPREHDFTAANRVLARLHIAPRG